MKLFTDPIVVLDTETTGLHQGAEVIEIGAVCLDEWGRIRSRFSALIQPNKLDRKALAALTVNQIPISALKRAPKAPEVANRFSKWLKAIPTKEGPVVCTAFNASFDRRMLNKMGLHLVWGQCVRSMSNAVMKRNNAQPKDRIGRPKAPSLEEACLYFSTPYPENAHRALADAEVTAQIAVEAYKHFRSA